MFGGKKDVVNYTTKHGDLAKKTQNMLKQKGFNNVRTMLNGKVMNEETELDENILATISSRKTAMLKNAKTSAAKVAIYSAKDHVELDKVKQRHGFNEDVEKLAESKNHPSLHKVIWMSNSSNKSEFFDNEKAAKKKFNDLQKSGLYHNVKHIPPSVKEDVEPLDELRGSTLGSYIQKARGEIKRKRERADALEKDDRVANMNDKITDLYNTREYTNSGKLKNRNKVSTLRMKIDARKKQIDPDFPKSINTSKRHAGIEKALKKLQSGKLTDEFDPELLDEGVKLDHSSYKNSHGKPAKGWGRWMLSKHKSIDFDKHKEGIDYHEHTGTWTAAAKSASKALGVKELYVCP
jgi:hypothetical protein